MGTYMEEYRRKLISADEAAKLVQSNDIVEYGMFATKPIDFDVALGKEQVTDCKMFRFELQDRCCLYRKLSNATPNRRPFSISAGISPLWIAKQLIWV